MSNLHPICLEWIDNSIQKMLQNLAKNRLQKRKIATEFMLHEFTMCRVDFVERCSCSEIDKKDEVLNSLHNFHGEYNLLYWQKLHAAKLLPFLRSAAAYDLTTESSRPGFGVVAHKEWMRDVLGSFLIEHPDKKWFQESGK